MKWLLKKIKVNELKEYGKNPRRLTEKGLKDLRKSIERFGIAEPLVVNTDMTICGGHGRKKILEEMKIKEVDCYFPEKKLTEKQFEELNIRLNKNIGGEFNFDILANEFELDELLSWGFEDYQFGVSIPELNRLEEWNEDNLEFSAADKTFNINIIFITEAMRMEFANRCNLKPDRTNAGQWTIRI